MKHFLVFSLAIFFVGTISFVFGQEFENYNIEVITVAENLDVPWEIAFAPDGKIFFTERVEKLRVIEDGQK